jgi:hypothetical protein
MAEHKDRQSGQATRGIGGSDRVAHAGKPGTHRPTHPGKPDEMPLTMGSNGGGREDNQPAGTDVGRKPRGTEAHPDHQKTS